jgi:hypothetical protein
MDEIAARFGTDTELRRAEFQSLTWMVDLALRAGVSRIIINGSYVTDVPEPNDVDCALLILPGFLQDAAAEAELLEGLPFLQISLVEPAEFEFLVHDLYATDRMAIPKGVVEIQR